MSDNGETPVRPSWRIAYQDSLATIDKLTTRTAEPSASASVETTAKGEPKPDVKVYAPMGCDYDALAAHAQAVADIAVESYGRAVAGLAKIAAETPFV